MIRTALYLLLTLNVFVVHAQNENNHQIPLDSLGQLQLNYKPVEHVKNHQGQVIKAQVSFQSREAFQLVAPFTAQSVKLLVGNGDLVHKNTPVMVLSGSEVHHFLEMLDAQKALYDMSAKRFEKNKKLYQKKTISSDKWASIASDYYEYKISYGHLRHFSELISSNNQEDSIVIKSPLEGFFLLPEAVSNDSEEMYLGQVLPAASLKVKMQMSIDSAAVESIITSKCSLKIEQSEKIATGYFVTLWSETIPENCQLILGQTIRVVPKFSTAAYQVPQSSVFTWDRLPHVLIQKNQNLVPTVIDIISSNKNGYLIQSTDDLTNSQVLTSSVSAVHGILLGMGGD